MALRSPLGWPRRTILEPQCTHLSMTRVYDPDARCMNCRLPGSFGWLYKCTQDREDMIEDAVTNGDADIFDELGRSMTQNLEARVKSPAAREDKLSFFREVTPTQLSQYRPDQVAIILRQRENVQISIQKQAIRTGGTAMLRRLESREDCCHRSKKLWVSETAEECQYRICPRCRPAAADRAYLSLNGVVNGDILPTAATGYGFQHIGERPVMNAQVLLNIGNRSKNQLPQTPKASEDSSMASNMSVMEVLGMQIAREHDRWVDQQNQAQHAKQSRPSRRRCSSGTQGQLKHSPGCDNLAAYAEPLDALALSTLQPRVWTPPPSPQQLADCYNMCTSLGIPLSRLAFGVSQSTTAQSPLFLDYSSTCPSDGPVEQANALGMAIPSPIKEHNQQAAHQPSEKQVRDAGEALPSTQKAAHLPEASTIESEQAGGCFAPAPLQVGHAVALLEESVELGVPDVITRG